MLITDNLNVKGVDDLEAILSTLSPALSTLEKALHKVRESASMESSHTGLAPVLRVNLGFAQNSEMCHSYSGYFYIHGCSTLYQWQMADATVLK